MKDKAQLTMFEAVIAIAIIILAYIFASYFTSPPSIRIAESSSKLEVFVKDILRTLDEYNPNGKPQYHYSLLTEYIISNTSDARKNLTGFLNTTLPSTALYNIYVYAPLTSSTYLWYPEDEPNPAVGTVIKGYRTIVYKGFVYEVQLEVWYV